MKKQKQKKTQTQTDTETYVGNRKETDIEKKQNQKQTFENTPKNCEVTKKNRALTVHYSIAECSVP